MSWQCDNCNHWTADGRTHVCINDEFEKAQKRIKELEAQLLTLVDSSNRELEQALIDVVSGLLQKHGFVHKCSIVDALSALESEGERG